MIKYLWKFVDKKQRICGLISVSLPFIINIIIIIIFYVLYSHLFFIHSSNLKCFLWIEKGSKEKKEFVMKIFKHSQEAAVKSNESAELPYSRICSFQSLFLPFDFSNLYQTKLKRMNKALNLDSKIFVR